VPRFMRPRKTLAVGTYGGVWMIDLTEGARK
jgi:hypothetical protein